MAEYTCYLNSEQIVERFKEIGPFVKQGKLGPYHSFVITDVEVGAPNKTAYLLVPAIDGDAFIPENMIEETIEDGKIWYSGGKPCLNQL